MAVSPGTREESDWRAEKEDTVHGTYGLQFWAYRPGWLGSVCCGYVVDGEGFSCGCIDSDVIDRRLHVLDVRYVAAGKP
jgi:hypothetical protein